MDSSPSYRLPIASPHPPASIQFCRFHPCLLAFHPFLGSSILFYGSPTPSIVARGSNRLFLAGATVCQRRGAPAPLPASTTWLTILKLFGNPFVDGELFESLQVAHIIPYALTKADDNCLDEGKKAAVAILNMFDLGVAHLIEGININRLYNALTLSPRAHKNFGDYQIFFEPLSDTDAPPSTYRIGTFRPPALARSLPIVRSFYMHPTIDPPSQRLLALHRAIAHILHLSRAGDYIENILRDMEDGIVRADGSTELGLMVDLALRVC